MRDLYTNNSDRGRRGSKIPKIRLTSFVHGPQTILPNAPRRHQDLERTNVVHQPALPLFRQANLQDNIMEKLAFNISLPHDFHFQFNH